MSNAFAVHDSGHRGSSASRSRRSGARRALSPLELLALLVIAVLLIVGILSAHPNPTVVAGRRSVQVEAGDTLWSIAKSHPLPGLSTAETAESIARANGLSTGGLVAGQTLTVPAATAGESNVASR